MSLRKRCGCVKRPRCEHPWHYDFAYRGTRYRENTRTADKEIARDAETQVKARLVSGDYDLKRVSPITLRKFWETYEGSYASLRHRASTLARTKRAWKVIERTLGDKMLSDITGEVMGKFASERLLAGCTPGNVNRELAVISGMLGMAVEWGYLKEKPKVPFLKTDNARTRILTDAEVVALLERYRGHGHYPIVALLAVTGARESEILNLKWEDVEGDEIVFLNTKNGRTRRLPKTQELAELLADLPKVGPYIFASSLHPQHRAVAPATFYAGFRKTCLALGWEDVCVHTLRHTALSRMVAAGHDLRTVQEISGHQDLKMLQRYTHPMQEAKRKALNTLSVTSLSRGASAVA